jgi:hypothetical protein
MAALRVLLWRMQRASAPGPTPTFLNDSDFAEFLNRLKAYACSRKAPQKMVAVPH